MAVPFNFTSFMRNSCEMIVSKRFEEQEMVAGDFSYFDTAFAFLCKACGRNVLIVSIIGHSVVHIGSVFVNVQYVVTWFISLLVLVHFSFGAHSYRKPHFVLKY